jgi:hypothetical protein
MAATVAPFRAQGMPRPRAATGRINEVLRLKQVLGLRDVPTRTARRRRPRPQGHNPHWIVVPNNVNCGPNCS